MADPLFRADQWNRRYERHVAPINEYVDSISTPLWLPYVAPLHGGIEAQVLTVLRDPGPGAGQTRGSGFLSIENDDPTAERQGHLLAEVGINPRHVLPWNAYPWYIDRAPTSAELQSGVDPILHLIELAPSLRVVLLQGGSAKNVWNRVTNRVPRLIRDRSLTVIDTYHPGRQALWHADSAVRAARIEHQHASFRQVAETLDIFDETSRDSAI
jgi:hypothetical protein